MYNVHMNKIIVLNMVNEILGVWMGLWNVEMWVEIEKELELGVEFNDWGKEEEEGEGWEVYGYDGLGVLVCGVDVDEKKCVREYWKMVKRKY